MRDFRDAKSMAHTLRDSLVARQLSLTHSESLELVAKLFGLEDWNTLSAKITAAQPQAKPGAKPGKKTLYCSFCKKSQHEVRKLVAGPTAFICDECIGLCDIIVEDTDIEALLNVAGEGAPLDALLAAKSTDELADLNKRASATYVRCKSEIDVARQVHARKLGNQPDEPDTASALERGLNAVLSPRSVPELESHIRRMERKLEFLSRAMSNLSTALGDHGGILN